MKKLFAIVLAFCLVLSISATALAVDGNEATSPSDGTNGATQGTSTGAATVGSSNGIDFMTENDDDDSASPTDTGGADIAVWARIASTGDDSDTVVYKLDVAWGAMSFEFNRGAGVWNPESHQYEASGTAIATWTNTFVDGANNKITVTNHTNSAIDATFGVNLNANVFNAAAGDDNVVGNFFATNSDALAAAGVLTAVASVSNKLADSKITLETAAPYGDGADAANNVDAGARTGEVFFAFSGTPDAGKTIASLSKVGTITVTFARNAKTYQPYYVAIP